MFPWMYSLWTYLDFTSFGLFVGANHKGVHGLTSSYWLVPGTVTA